MFPKQQLPVVVDPTTEERALILLQVARSRFEPSTATLPDVHPELQ